MSLFLIGFTALALVTGARILFGTYRNRIDDTPEQRTR